MPATDSKTHVDDIRAYFDSDNYSPGYGHAATIAACTQVLARLPNDAWLTPCTEPAKDDDAGREIS